YGCSRDTGTQWHSGIDLAAAVGTELKAIYSGKILNIPSSIRDLKPTDTNYKKDLGNYIIVKSDGFSVKYCHLSQIDVALGDTIELGQVLGKTGKSGNAFDVPNKHLHLEVSTDHFGSNNNKVDPEPYLKTKYKKNGTVGTPSENPNNSDHSKCP
ncbi:MAG: M23 family metallopeptidase, partial [Sphingobacteriales bacterium]